MTVENIDYNGQRVEVVAGGKGWRVPIYPPDSPSALRESPSILEKVPKETVIAEAKKIVDARAPTNRDGRLAVRLVAETTQGLWAACDSLSPKPVAGLRGLEPADVISTMFITARGRKVSGPTMFAENAPNHITVRQLFYQAGARVRF